MGLSWSGQRRRCDGRRGGQPGVSGACERRTGHCWAKMAGSWATREGEKDLAGWTSGRILAQSKIKEGKPFSFKQIGKPI
jgi:hypothetical protein